MGLLQYMDLSIVEVHGINCDKLFNEWNVMNGLI